MSDEQQMVAAFHQAFDSVIGGHPAIPDDATCALRLSLIQEEFDELRAALAQRDVTEVAKELADLLYVVYGTAVSCGIDMAPVFQEVHRSNMSKVGGRKRADGKWLKPPDYQPARLRPLLLAQGMPPQDMSKVGMCQRADDPGLPSDSDAPAPPLPRLPSGSADPAPPTVVMASHSPMPVKPALVVLTGQGHHILDRSSATIDTLSSPLDPETVRPIQPGRPQRHETLHLQCPRCRKNFVRRSHRTGLTERFLSYFYVYPFRCQVCAYRFRAFRFRAHYTKSLVDRRQYERVLVHFPVAFTEAVKPGEYRTGTGIVTDMALGGCFIHTVTRLTEGAVLSLELQTDKHGPVLTVEAAIVRSTRSLGAGLEFLRLMEPEHERLSTLMRRLHAEQDEVAAAQPSQETWQQQ